MATISRGDRIRPRRAAGPLFLGSVFCLIGAAWSGEAETPAMPKAVNNAMKQMQDLFGGGGGQAGGEGQADIKTIKKLLAKERNVKAWESRGRIFLEGRVTSKHMQRRIQKLLEVYGNLVDLTEYQPEMDTFLADMEMIKEKIEDTLNKNFERGTSFVSGQEVSVSIVNDKIVISGELNTKEDIEKALHIAKIYNDNVVDNLSVRKQMIEVAAIFAKVKKTDTDKLGTQGLQSAIVTLPVITAAATDGTPTRYPFDYFRSYRHTASPSIYGLGGIESPQANIAFFNFFKKNAILARPHLASVNGQSSKFLGGGEKAIKTVTANASDVNYKEYGVILETTPSLTTDGRINLKLSLEFSVPEANGEDFVTFRHEGEAILSHGQGMVLSGLINEARSRGFTRTPFLGKVPILNFFFSQKEESKESEDLVLITIPRVPGDVRKAPYPKTEDTAQAATDAFWIHKPDVPHRMLDRLKGKEGRYWLEGAEVLIEEPEEEAEQGAPGGADTQPEAASEPGKAGANAQPAAAPAPADAAAVKAAEAMPEKAPEEDARRDPQPPEADASETAGVSRPAAAEEPFDGARQPTAPPPAVLEEEAAREEDAGADQPTAMAPPPFERSAQPTADEESPSSVPPPVSLSWAHGRAQSEEPAVDSDEVTQVDVPGVPVYERRVVHVVR